MTLPDWVDTALYPWTPRIERIDGHDISFVDVGSGPVVLFVHGNPTWSFVWRDVIAGLAGTHRCIAVDLPGFGLSTAADGFDGRPEHLADALGALVERLDLRDATLVAQDWGGPVGLAVAEAMPDRFRALVLANTWAWPITGDRHFERFAGMMGGAIGAALIRRLNLFVNAMIPVGHRRRRPTRAEMRHYRRALATPARRQASAVLPREITASAPFLARVEAGLPALASRRVALVWADRDIAFREHELARWRSVFPRASVIRAPGAGHFVPSDAPDEMIAGVRSVSR